MPWDAGLEERPWLPWQAPDQSFNPYFRIRRRPNGQEDTAVVKGVRIVKMTMNAKPGARILFLDMDSVEVQHNVLQRVLEATKHPANPLIPLGDAYEWDSLQAAP